VFRVTTVRDPGQIPLRAKSFPIVEDLVSLTLDADDFCLLWANMELVRTMIGGAVEAIPEADRRVPAVVTISKSADYFLTIAGQAMAYIPIVPYSLAPQGHIVTGFVLDREMHKLPTSGADSA
jgi:hypothetical protein